VVQNFSGFVTAQTLDGATQMIPGGPVASQEAIKELGTNGGGFFNANSAHPFENPDGLTNLIQIWALLAIPFAMTSAFGRLAGDRRQGWAVFAAMLVLWAVPAGLAMHFESRDNPRLAEAGLVAGDGNLEGKETRYGPAASGLFAASTTGTSTGAVNSSHDSFTPAGGAVPLTNMMLGEVSPGGTGSGLYGMLVFALLTVFLAGLMVGRTPEYLGKSLRAPEVKLIVVYLAVVPFVVLTLTAIGVAVGDLRASIQEPGPHGLTEILYAFTSATSTQATALGGFTGNTDWINASLGLAMLAGRFLLIVPVLAVAGSLARRAPAPAGPGTFPTTGPIFTVLLVAVVITVVGLTYFPVLALGPVLEELSL
jgi:K+-transporting ATPase ATPase A chain